MVKKGVCLAFCLLAGMSGRLLAAGTYSGGNGEPNNPYRIATPNDMNDIGNHTDDWNKYFVMVNDINLAEYTGTQFNIIGYYYDFFGNPDNIPFSGVFDGNSHTISNFICNRTDIDVIGLFRLIEGTNAVIKDLGLIDPNVDGGSRDYIGSLVGVIQQGSIEGCFTRSGSVAGSGRIGGLIGGLIGVTVNNDSNVSNCYSTTKVTGHHEVGGLIGKAGATGRETILILNCYSAGAIIGTEGHWRIGGFIGSGSPMATSCFWDIESSGQTTSSIGVGKTTAQMHTKSTFPGWGCAGSAWTINDGVDYPHLEWENMPGELIIKPLYGGGSGTAEDPYLIYTDEHLNTIGLAYCDMNEHFRLMADIDLSVYSGTQFNIIGQQITPFTGVFDGNEKKIYNFNYHAEAWEPRIGLFGIVSGYDSEIKSLGLIDPNVATTSGYGTGALVGNLIRGSVRDCYIQGGVIVGEDRVGGLVGYSSGEYVPGDPGALIENCYTNCMVRGTGYFTGGLVGQNLSRIYNCYSTGNVQGVSEVGGLVGANRYGAVIRRSYALCEVNGSGSVGGFVGDNESAKIYDCYSNGNVTGNSKVGGFSGNSRLGMMNYKPYFYRCYSCSQVNGGVNVGLFLGRDLANETRFYDCFYNSDVNDSLIGIGSKSSDPSEVIGENTTNMQLTGMFMAHGWDFVGVWDICAGTNYPKLSWQVPLPGDFVCPDGVDFGDYAVFANQWELEVLACDVYPQGGDGFVDFLDWAALADGWKDTADINDVADFSEQWLRYGAYSGDISPAPDGDGFVDFSDFSVFALHWLEE